MRRPLLVVSTLLALAACGEATRPTGPVMGNTPGFAISDGANSGGGPANGDFFFLPPMVPDPSGALTYDAGGFDATMSPRVEICLLTTTEPRACAAEPFRVFEGAAISVSTTDEHYHVNWHTNEDDLSVDHLYRIAISVPRREHDGQMLYRTLGFADVDPVNTGKELKNIATGQVIGLVDGRTLPIKFRIERSPSCEESDDCVEAVLSDEGGRVETETGYAIAEFPAGWLPEGFADEDVVVTIRRIAIGSAPGQDPSCHGTAHVQYEGCYDFETYPDVGTFALPAVISTCIEPDAAPFEELLQLAASDDGENFRLLPPRRVTIECEGFQGTQAPIGFLGRIGERMLALGMRLGVALAPRELYAVDKGRGGAIDSFSRGGWVLPLSMSLLSPEGETYTVSTGARLPVSVLVRSAHETEEDPTPVAGLPVAFTLSDGGGTLDPAVVPTNADGVASTTWTVGAVGEHVLTASVGGAELTLTVNSVAALPTTTVLQAPAVAIDGDETVLTAIVVGGSPGENESPIVSFYDGDEQLGSAPANSDGAATLVVSTWALRSHVITAVFQGTPSLLPSQSAPATVQVLRRHAELESFFGELGDNPVDSENFDEFEGSPTIATIIPGVLAVSSTFPDLQVTGGQLFGFGGTVRVDGTGRYTLDLLAARSAIAFNVEAKNPATGPMTIEVHTAAGVRVFSVQNFQTETDPVFFSVVASQPIVRVVVIEGPEVGGTGNEETALDDFFVSSAFGPF